jgi:hypothetical protein
MNGSMQAMARISAATCALAVLASGAGCATGARQQAPAGGSLTVGVTTTGAAAADVRYRLTIEPAGIVGTLKAQAGVFTTDALSPGEHVVRLAEVPAACRVDGGTERRITISDERRFVVIRFDVRCD